MKSGFYRCLTVFALVALLTTAFSACRKQPSDVSGDAETSDVSAAVSAQEGEQTEADRAYTLYEAALKKQEKAGGFDATLTGGATVVSGGNTTEWTFDVTWVSQQKSAEEADFLDHLTESLAKSNDVIERDVYYGKGTLYASQNGQKFRQLMDRKAAIGETALFTKPKMTKAAFADPLIVSEAGDTVLSLTMNGDILSEELTSDAGALVYLLGSTAPDANFTFGETTVTATFNEDGYLTKYSLMYSAVGDDEAQTSVNVSLSITYDRVGEAITVRLPDASKYKERIGSGLSREAYDVMTDVVDLLFGADGDRVDDFDSAYEAACKQYKKKLVDEIVEWFEEQ